MKLAFRNLLRRPVRTLLALSGIAVSVAYFVALRSYGLGFKKGIDEYARSAGADLVVHERDKWDPAWGRIKDEEVEGLRRLPFVAWASVSSGSPSVGPGGQPRIVIGRMPGEPLMKAYTRGLQGRLLADEGEVMLGEIMARETGKKIGDTVKLLGRDLKVVGIYRAGTYWETGGAVAHLSLVRKELHPGYAGVLVFLGLRDPDRWEEAIEIINSRFPRLRAIRSLTATSFLEQMNYVDDFIWLISATALLMSVILIATTMLMSVYERIREIGTLRAFGWTRGMVVRLVLREGLMLCATGGLVGIGLGVVGSIGLHRLIIPRGYIQPEFALETIGTSFAMAVVIGVLGAIYPCYRASRLAPAEALRYE